MAGDADGAVAFFLNAAVIDIVGLTRSLLGLYTPFLTKWAAKSGITSFKPAFPALTCTAQSTYLTGKSEGEHGIVANGWYDRESAEVKFWKQSNHLVHGQKIWESLREKFSREKYFTCAKMFWWYNMYSSADFSATPRPLYPAANRQIFIASSTTKFHLTGKGIKNKTHHFNICGKNF